MVKTYLHFSCIYFYYIGKNIMSIKNVYKNKYSYIDIVFGF
jgi:hypothetical protein